MPAKKKTTSNPAPQSGQRMGELAVRDIAKQVVREAMREQSQNIQTALNDIDRRLKSLEE